MTSTRPASLVTGASGAIGHELALSLAAQGHRLTLTGRDEGRLLAAADDCRRHDGEVRCDVGDLRSEAYRAGLVARHVEAFGRLDVLVANAGGGRAAPLAGSDDRSVESALALNLLAPLELARAAVAEMLPRGAGWIVITASIAGIRPTAGAAAYSAAKAGVVSVARSINLEHAAQGVRACALCPGFVDTPMSVWAQEHVPAEEMLQPGDLRAGLELLLRLSPNAVLDELVLRRATARPFEP